MQAKVNKYSNKTNIGTIKQQYMVKERESFKKRQSLLNNTVEKIEES